MPSPVRSGRRPEIRAKLLVGAVTLVGGCALLLTLSGHSPIWLLILIALVVGIPQGLNSLAKRRIGSSPGHRPSDLRLDAEDAPGECAPSPYDV